LLLVVLFAVAINFVVRRTAEMRGAASDVSAHLAERVSAALSNLRVLHSFERIEMEARGFRDLSERLARAQFPLPTWWAIASVATRASSKLSLLSIFTTGVWLNIRSQTAACEVVAFMSLATGLIGRFEQIVGFVNILFGQAPQLRQ